jgi:hypothetical protein
MPTAAVSQITAGALQQEASGKTAEKAALTAALQDTNAKTMTASVSLPITSAMAQHASAAAQARIRLTLQETAACRQSSQLNHIQLLLIQGLQGYWEALLLQRAQV